MYRFYLYIYRIYLYNIIYFQPQLYLTTVRYTHCMLVGDGLKTDERKYFLHSNNDLGFAATEVVEADIFNGFKKGFDGFMDHRSINRC